MFLITVQYYRGFNYYDPVLQRSIDFINLLILLEVYSKYLITRVYYYIE